MRSEGIRDHRQRTAQVRFQHLLLVALGLQVEEADRAAELKAGAEGFAAERSGRMVEEAASDGPGPGPVDAPPPERRGAAGERDVVLGADAFREGVAGTAPCAELWRESYGRLSFACGLTFEPPLPDGALPALVTLRASLTAPESDGEPFENVFHSHSSGVPGALRPRALQPAPIPSTASRGSSSLRKCSQLAYTNLSSQYIVTKSASSTITLYTLRSPGWRGAVFSRNDEPSMVAKYSDRLVRMSACAHMMRLRATVCCPGASEVEEAWLEGPAVLGVGGSCSSRSCSSRRSKQTNCTSPVSQSRMSILCGNLMVERELTWIVKGSLESFQKVARHVVCGRLLWEERAHGRVHLHAYNERVSFPDPWVLEE